MAMLANTCPRPRRNGAGRAVHPEMSGGILLKDEEGYVIFLDIWPKG